MVISAHILYISFAIIYSSCANLIIIIEKFSNQKIENRH